MALRQLRYEGDISLKKTCKEVLTVDDKIRELLDDMMDTLRATGNGAALAANQVGILKRLVVVDYGDCWSILKSSDKAVYRNASKAASASPIVLA